jgi:beta-glucosidase/6-phospho-beta-glucosidase/beta-galactosidase
MTWVDRATQDRTPKESLEYYHQVIRAAEAVQ